ncbi:YecA family protein [Bacillus sp. AFS015896]|uniref:YecA family protein n=1 Tax=Bacillus sp. AFS015896 TaxID=2033487 RepID=UPI000BF58A16|nr:SEC-C metal-binding domain-containing protein [Bacillus sp. AFS015896]PFA60041.1 zinc chelation protein SecC [Bacillus sp. AFS015896]
MENHQISRYLKHFKGTKLRSNILEELSGLKIIAVNRGDQAEAKNIWCLEQVYKVINHFITAYKQLVDKEYFEAWCELDRADINLHFLRRHLDYTGNKYNLEFIEKNIFQLQKLFPYKYFLSRESIIEKWTCSICNQVIKLRNPCNHKVGEIYNGELCSRVARDIKILGVALVTNPFDKYTVLFPEDKEYNYAKLEYLMKYWTSPYEKWELLISEDLNDEYRNLGRNDFCICNSGKKYKKCCLKTGEDKHIHQKLLFMEKKQKDFKPIKKLMFSNWKD